MAECIVCQGEYTPGQLCRRCGSDNRPWEAWQNREQGGLAGMLAFAAPHFYLPILVILLSLFFGLIGLIGFWSGIRPGMRLLALLVAVGGCIVVFQDVYSHRRAIRLQRLLDRVRRGWGVKIMNAKLWAIILPALVLLSTCPLTYILVSSDVLWDLTRWLVFEPGYGGQVEGGLRERILEALPFLMMFAHVGLTISFTYASSVMLALHHAQEMDRELPLPIFLRGDLLAEVVRREVESQLARPGGYVIHTSREKERWLAEGQYKVPEPSNGAALAPLYLPPVPGPSDQPVLPLIPPGLHSSSRWRETVERFGRWNWEEVERTPDGGISMKARGEYQVKKGETEAGFSKESSVAVIYTVKADPWGRIQKISRSTEEQSKDKDKDK